MDGVTAGADVTPYRLAYEEAVRSSEAQARVLDGLRSHAGTVLAAAAIVTSFLGGLGLSRRGAAEVRIGIYGWTAIALFLVVALLTLIILLPFGVWRFSLDAALIIGLADARSAAEPVSAVEAYRELALRLRADYVRNGGKIRVLFWLFRAATAVLALEVGAWIIDISQV
jgi:hypothetical protein